MSGGSQLGRRHTGSSYTGRRGALSPKFQTRYFGSTWQSSNPGKGVESVRKYGLLERPCSIHVVDGQEGRAPIE